MAGTTHASLDVVENKKQKVRSLCGRLVSAYRTIFMHGDWDYPSCRMCCDMVMEIERERLKDVPE